MKRNKAIALLLTAAVLSGCSSSGHRAPVTERGESANKKAATEAVTKKAARNKDWRPEVHVVQKGDTLYGIAFNYGFDYHELAEMNGIQDPGVISIGQEIHLFPGKSKAVAPVSPVEAKPVENLVKEQPKLVKYAYSPAAVAQIDKVQEPAKSVAPVVAVENIPAKPESKPDAEAPGDDSADDGEEVALEWGLPAQGKLIGNFSESANRKGIDIAGKLGQPVLASAPGKVVYSGSGLRGYGKLIIIKHNKTYLSAYAHNDKVLVKEGQVITRGQKIAEMGNTDADRVKLHFEVRRFGKPVDPAKYLPLGKS
ncbi:MAG: peptidoglycan DD-metalloendopeptidase family protein [Nitrosomonadales bacterium]|nr:peptidoglycan DD-metalloendopeptidase family protein [Nitrosomonadales bacterium]